MQLILTEKYKVASEFAGVLGAKTIVKGKNKWFESDEYVIVWASGHLFRMLDPEEYEQRYSIWIIEDLPIIPEEFDIKLTNSSLFSTVKNQILRKDISTIYIATDAGREGELIGRDILEKIKCNKPVKRIWLRGMTEIEIMKAISEAKPLSYYDRIYQSAKARSQADWLLGINLTRAYSLSRMNGSGKPMHIGRCQTPILTMVCKRDNEIDNFVPEQYWEINGFFNQKGVTYTGLWYDRSSGSSKIESKEKVEEIEKNIWNVSCKIEEISIERKNINPPKLFNLTNLQKTLAKKYGLTAQQTLDIAQKLYECKLLSYPRTSSRRITSSMAREVGSLLRVLSFSKFESIVDRILGGKEFNVPERIIDDMDASDHTAIMPIINDSITNIYNRLSDYERFLYDEVVLNLLSNFFPAYKYDSIKIVTKAGGEYFITYGISIIEKGWRQIYNDISDEEKNELPQMEEDLEVNMIGHEVQEKTTKPPQHYSEDGILSIMESPQSLIANKQLQVAIKGHGIGTEATRATIIETLLKRGYLRRIGKSIVATEQGKRLIDSIDIEPLKSAELTAIWEMLLEQIEIGKIDKAEFMDMVENFIVDCVKSIKRKA